MASQVEHEADLDLLDAGCHQLADLDVAEVLARSDEGLAGLGVGDLGGRRPGVHHGLGVLVLDHGAVGQALADPLGQTALGAAVVLTDDDVLRDVDQATGQVARVGRARAVGHALAGAVGGDQVLQHREALANFALIGRGMISPLGVGHQAAHGADLTDLVHVPRRARVDHHVDRVGLVVSVLHRLADLARGLGPDLDKLLATLVVGDQSALVLLLHLGGVGLEELEDLGLVGRLGDVVDGHGHARAGRPGEAGLLQGVQRRGDLDLGVALGEVVDDRAEGLLADLVVHEGVVGRQGVVEQRAAQGGLEGHRETLLGVGAEASSGGTMSSKRILTTLCSEISPAS